MLYIIIIIIIKELVPGVIGPTVQWRIQMVGVSVACSSMELVPSVDLLYSGGYRWWVLVSPVPLSIWCRV